MGNGNQILNTIREHTPFLSESWFYILHKKIKCIPGRFLWHDALLNKILLLLNSWNLDPIDIGGKQILHFVHRSRSDCIAVKRQAITDTYETMKNTETIDLIYTMEGIVKHLNLAKTISEFRH